MDRYFKNANPKGDKWSVFPSGFKFVCDNEPFALHKSFELIFKRLAIMLISS